MGAEQQFQGMPYELRIMLDFDDSCILDVHALFLHVAFIF